MICHHSFSFFLLLQNGFFFSWWCQRRQRNIIFVTNQQFSFLFFLSRYFHIRSVFVVPSDDWDLLLVMGCVCPNMRFFAKLERKIYIWFSFCSVQKLNQPKVNDFLFFYNRALCMFVAEENMIISMLCATPIYWSCIKLAYIHNVSLTVWMCFVLLSYCFDVILLNLVFFSLALLFHLRNH